MLVFSTFIVFLAQKQGPIKARTFAQVRQTNGDVQIRTTRAQQLRSKKILENKNGNQTAPKRERPGLVIVAILYRKSTL